MGVRDWEIAAADHQKTEKRKHADHMISHMRAAEKILLDIDEKNDDEYINAVMNINIRMKQMYMDIAELSRMQNDDFQSRDPDRMVTQNADEYVKVIGFSEEAFVMETVIPQKQVKGYRYTDTHLGKITAESIRRYMEKENIRCPVYTKAHIKFELFFGQDIPTSSIPDADNVSIKSIIDGMCHMLFGDDNLIDLGVTICGARTDQKSFMRITVYEKKAA